MKTLSFEFGRCYNLNRTTSKSSAENECDTNPLPCGSVFCVTKENVWSNHC